MSITVAQHTNVLSIIATSRLLGKHKVTQVQIENEANRLNSLICEYWKAAKVDVDLLEFGVNLILNNMADFVNPVMHNKVICFYAADYTVIDENEDDYDF